MKFPSLSRLFGKRWPRKQSRRNPRPATRRAELFLESLESRELLAAPFIVRNAVTPLPPDGSITSDPHPTLSLTYSEQVNAAEARTTTNYLLFDSTGNPISVDSVTYDATSNTVFLLYNGGVPLPADTFTLFVRGDQIHDLDEGLALARPGELVTVNGGGGNVSQFGVPGDGTLSAGTNYLPSNQTFLGSQAQPQAVSLADLTGDSVPELIVASAAANTTPGNPQQTQVDIYNGLPLPERGFVNTPTQTLIIPNAGTTPLIPQAMVVTDLDNDGAADIAIATFASTVTVFLNKGNFVGTTYSLSNVPTGLAAGDFDGNGSVDLAAAVAGNGPNNLTVLFNSGTGTFGTSASFATGLVGLRALAAGNLDSQPGLDIAVASGLGGIQVMANTPGGPPGSGVNFTPLGGPLAASTSFTSIAVGLIDGDALPDIAATTNAFGNQAIVFLNSPSAVFSQLPSFPANPGGGGGNIAGINLADVNGDGRNDILVVNTSGFGNNDTMSVLLSNSNVGTFAPPVGYAVDQGASALAVHLNSAGVVDLAATANTIDTTVLRAKGDGTFFETRDTPVGTLGSFSNALSDAVSGDLNGDGVQDLVFADQSTNQISVMLSTPSGFSPFAIPTTYPVGAGPVGIALGDLTGSGRLDILVANQNDSTVTILANIGSGLFSPTAIAATGNSPTGIAVGDFNGDGNLDFVTSHDLFGSFQPTDHGVTVSLGRGDRTFNTPIVGSPGTELEFAL